MQTTNSPTVIPVTIRAAQLPMVGRGRVGFGFRFSTKVGVGVGNSFIFLTFSDPTRLKKEMIIK
jgi:hypothetical protein